MKKRKEQAEFFDYDGNVYMRLTYNNRLPVWYVEDDSCSEFKMIIENLHLYERLDALYEQIRASSNS